MFRILIFRIRYIFILRYKYIFVKQILYPITNLLLPKSSSPNSNFVFPFCGPSQSYPFIIYFNSLLYHPLDVKSLPTKRWKAEFTDYPTALNMRP